MSTTLSNNKSSAMVWIKWAVTILLPLVLLLVPCGELFTVAVRSYCIITMVIIFMFAFELLPMIWPCILMTVFYVIFDVAPINVALNVWSANLTIYMLIAALAFAYVLEETGLLHRIALIVISKCGGTFGGVLVGLYVAGVLLSFMTFSTGWFVIAAFGLGVCKAMGYTERCKESALLMIVTCMAAFSSPFVLDPKKLALWEPAFTLVGPNYYPDWTMFLTYGWPYFIFCLIFLWIFIKVTKANQYSVEGSKEFFLAEKQKLGPMKTAEKKAAVGVAVLMLFLLTAPFHKISSNYGFIFITLCFFLPGINIGTMKSIAKIDIGTILFLAACMSIGAVGLYVGITDCILAVALPLLEHMNFIAVMFLLIAIGTIANIFMTPAAFSACLAVPAISIALAANIDPQVSIMCLSFATDQYFFPHELTVTIVIYSWGLISMKDFVKYMSLKVGLFLILFIPLFVPYWFLIGLL